MAGLLGRSFFPYVVGDISEIQDYLVRSVLLYVVEEISLHEKYRILIPLIFVSQVIGSQTYMNNWNQSPESKTRPCVSIFKE
jgi:hypothetical protein